MAFNWYAVENSSHITALARDDLTRDVAVKFHDGAEYIYHGVSDEDWENLMDSGSKGRFVNITLRRKYNYDKIR